MSSLPSASKTPTKTLQDTREEPGSGPLGVFEMKGFEGGTYRLIDTLVRRTKEGAITIIGGGDSVSAVMQAGVADKIKHISTGGGASLEFLEGKKLPGVEALSPAPSSPRSSTTTGDLSA